MLRVLRRHGRADRRRRTHDQIRWQRNTSDGTLTAQRQVGHLALALPGDVAFAVCLRRLGPARAA